MGSNLSWAAVPGGTYSYGQGVSTGISANYAANSIGYSYSGSLPSGVGWTGGGFSGTADQVGSFGGTVYATEYGSNGTSEAISAGYGLTVNRGGPSWTSAPARGRSRPGRAAGATPSRRVADQPRRSGVSAGSLPAGVGMSNGVISGTPGVGTGGVYNVTVDASNGYSAIYTNYALTVDESPTITSANSTTFDVGDAGTYPVTSSGSSYPTPGSVGDRSTPVGGDFRR